MTDGHRLRLLAGWAIPLGLIALATIFLLAGGSSPPVAQSSPDHSLGVEAADRECVHTWRINATGGYATPEEALATVQDDGSEFERRDPTNREVRFERHEGDRLDHSYRVVRSASERWLVVESSQSHPCDRVDETQPYGPGTL